MKVESESEVAQSCPTLSDPMDCSLPGSSIHGIFQARVLEWVAVAFSVCVYREVQISSDCEVILQVLSVCTRGGRGGHLSVCTRGRDRGHLSVCTRGGRGGHLSVCTRGGDGGVWWR